MMQPPADLSRQLKDNCNNCSALEEPVAVNGPSSNPTAAYKCANCRCIWFVEWQQLFQRVAQDTVTPASSPSPASPRQPECISCGAPLGTPHSPSCQFTPGQAN